MLNSFSARAVAETLVIDHVGHRGDGVARVDDATAFVPYALPGEVVTARRNDRANERHALIDVITASHERIAPFCPHFGTCGGCAIQHWQPHAYQAWKRQIVVDTLAQAKIDCPVGPLVDAHGAGRRRLTLHARREDVGRMRVGFAAVGSHAIVAIETCPILDPALDGALEAARDIAEALKGTGKPLDIQMTATANGHDVDVRGSGTLPPPLIVALSRVAERHKLARLTRHGELVLQRTTPIVAMGKAHVALPPGAFLQATVAGEAALAEQVIAHCKGARHIADLFCGVGPFALRLAERARISAFDNDEAAIAALQKAAGATSGLKPVKAQARDLFRRPLVPQELRDIDAVVFDPPRQGALAQVQQLAASKIAIVVAVSCNPATFARDARVLIDGGYRIEGVSPVDQFRHSAHIELVARFTRSR